MLRILNFGKYNENAGPDFEFAKIELGQQTWIGNIEIHWSSSEWYQHKHQLDARYNTTILHFVWHHTDTQPTYRKDGTIIPTLELQHFVHPALLTKYQYLDGTRGMAPVRKTIAIYRSLSKNQLVGQNYRRTARVEN